MVSAKCCTASFEEFWQTARKRHSINARETKCSSVSKTFFVYYDRELNNSSFYFFRRNVELPVSGSSYNPSIDDYNELKQVVIQKERKKIKYSQHLDRVVTQKFTKMSTEEKEAMVLKEMSEGLFENEG